MEPLDGEAILEAARKRREVEAIRQAAIQKLLANSKPNVGGAVANFVCAAALWAFATWMGLSIGEADSTISWLNVVLGAVFPVWFAWSGYRCLVVDPRDRLLLLLAQEALLKTDAEQQAKRSEDTSN